MSRTVLAMGLGDIMYKGENFEKMTQYGEFGTLDVYSDIIMPLNFLIFCKHNYIVSVGGSSIVLYIECLGGMFLREFF